MRFQRQSQSNLRYGCLAYKEIAGLVKRSIEYCRQVCLRYKEKAKSRYSFPYVKTRSRHIQRDNAPSQRDKFNQIQVDHLVDRGTLQMQIGRSLEERAADFTRVFPTKRLGRSKLSRIYRDQKVRKKKVKITKILNQRQRRKINRYIP